MASARRLDRLFRRRPLQGVPAFGAIWAGQLVSLFGTRLSSFGISVWVFQKTGSATSFAMIALVATLPVLLLGPIAGAVADRRSRRALMLLGDLGAALGSLALLVLFATDRIEMWHLYLLVFGTSVGSAFQAPAFHAAITHLVPRRQYGRAGGLLSMAPAIVNLAAPPVAGILLVRIGIEQVLVLDLATFGVALLSLMAVRIPKPERLAEDHLASSLGQRVLHGWRFIRDRPGLSALLAYQAMVYVLITLLGVLLVPVALGFASPAVAGTILSAGGAGMLVGSLLMTVSGGIRRRVLGVFGGGILFGTGFALIGARPSATFMAAALFLTLFSFPIIQTSGQVIWRLKVPAAAQGRVFAMRTTILDATRPVVLLAAGPLADHLFEPLMRDGGRLSGSLGPFLGTGPGRGIALMFVLVGFCHLAASLAFSRIRSLREVEEDLPDAVIDPLRSFDRGSVLSAPARQPASS